MAKGNGMIDLEKVRIDLLDLLFIGGVDNAVVVQIDLHQVFQKVGSQPGGAVDIKTEQPPELMEPIRDPQHLRQYIGHFLTCNDMVIIHQQAFFVAVMIIKAPFGHMAGVADRLYCYILVSIFFKQVNCGGKQLFFDFHSFHLLSVQAVHAMIFFYRYSIPYFS